MPKWKPKTPHEKFLTELRKLQTKITAKQAELAQLEEARQQIEMVVAALRQTEPGDSRKPGA